MRFKRIWMASQMHSKCIPNAFQMHLGKCLVEKRLWQRVLQMRWPGPPTVTQGRRKGKKKKERSNLEHVESLATYLSAATVLKENT